MTDYTQPIAIDSEHRVAFELMEKIDKATPPDQEFSTNPKKYYINLYVDCLEAVRFQSRQS